MNNLFRLIAVGGLVAFAVLMIALGMARNTAALAAPLNLLLFVLGVVFYVLPTGLAFYRNCKAANWIAVLNVLLGWTGFGWVVALGWAATGKAYAIPPAIPAPPTQVLHGH